MIGLVLRFTIGAGLCFSFIKGSFDSFIGLDSSSPPLPKLWLPLDTIGLFSENFPFIQLPSLDISLPFITMHIGLLKHAKGIYIFGKEF